jgi:2-dehydro-3-deoxygalactonokinase
VGARATMPVAMLIALDWGTTSLRAYLLDGRGTVVDQRAAPLGILNVPSGDFEAAFEQTCADWFSAHGTLNTLACGMIGSRQGWREARYVNCPAALSDLALKLTRFPTMRGAGFAIVPGLTCQNALGVPDVLRGEETQILGALLEDSTNTQIFVLPGTHSKWVLTEAGTVVSFATFMTGELFALLRNHSILGKTMDGDAHDAQAFDQGCDYARDEAEKGAGLLHALFSARTLRLTERIAARSAHAYLSGLLIGAELLEALRYFAAPRSVLLIGEPLLVARYQQAARRCGVEAAIADSETTVRGLWRIACAAQSASPSPLDGGS